MKKGTKQSFYTAGAITVMAVAVSLTGCAGREANVVFPNMMTVQNVESAINKVTVTGQEEVKVVPDMAKITYAVTTRKDTAEECQTQNSTDLSNTIEKLKSLGVEEKSIQTSSYGMNPIYNWNSSQQEITGYEMTTRLTVSDIPIDDAGRIISESVAAGVNGIDSVDYFSSSYDEKYQEALKGAMEVAKAKAEALAEASGQSLIGVLNVEESGYNPSVRNSTYSAPGAAKTEAAAADMAVMPGEVTIEARVTVDYQIQ